MIPLFKYIEASMMKVKSTIYIQVIKIPDLFIVKKCTTQLLTRNPITLTKTINLTSQWTVRWRTSIKHLNFKVKDWIFSLLLFPLVCQYHICFAYIFTKRKHMQLNRIKIFFSETIKPNWAEVIFGWSTFKIMSHSPSNMASIAKNRSFFYLELAQIWSVTYVQASIKFRSQIENQVSDYRPQVYYYYHLLKGNINYLYIRVLYFNCSTCV